MAMGRQKDGQGDLMVSWSEMPRSPGHVFYDRLQSVLIEGGFDAFAEASCRPYYAVQMGSALGAARALFPDAPGGTTLGGYIIMVDFFHDIDVYSPFQTGERGGNGKSRFQPPSVRWSHEGPSYSCERTTTGNTVCF